MAKFMQRLGGATKAILKVEPQITGIRIVYKVARVPKRAGTFREIYIASNNDKRRLRALLPPLERILAELDDCRVNYAFEKGKNCALNALQHIGHRYNLSMDLENFFDSVTPEHVKDVIPAEIIKQCFVAGNPKQGLPTSPIIATIAFLQCDRRIIDMLRKLSIYAVYTRYADDLLFSFDDRRLTGKIITIVRQIVSDHGFRINNFKTRLQDSKNGRIVINGMAIDTRGIHPTRYTKKRIRAASHQQNASSLVGLLEWAKCKLPSSI
jgi:hypothetical protein